jgi:hypothetical protein
MTPVRLLVLSLAAAVSGVAAASADPTPAGSWPQAPAAIEGRLGEPLSNGVLRFKLVEVRSARPQDHPESVVPLASEKVMVVTARLRNLSPQAFAERLTYTLDENGEASFKIPQHFLTPIALRIPPGGTAAQSAVFPVDKALVPTTLLLQCSSCGQNFKPLRVTLPSPPP